MDERKILEEIKKIANNALYFDDNSDYQSALWEILITLNPNAGEEKLRFIE